MHCKHKNSPIKNPVFKNIKTASAKNGLLINRNISQLNFKIKEGSDVNFDSNYFYLVMDDRGGTFDLDFLLGSIDTLP